MTPRAAETYDRATVSVVIPTWRRPEYLRLTLDALTRQTLSGFEVIVVGDQPSAVACGAPLSLADKITYLQADAPNISRARNLGVSVASAPIIAFLDDDATPSPHWLERLIIPFEDETVGAVSGRQRDPNGLADAGVASTMNGAGSGQALTFDETADATVLAAPENNFPCVIGANCAFHRKALADVGAFDEAFVFHLDENDVCARLARNGWRVAASPRAEVLHWRAPGDHRKSNGAPRSLFELGASIFMFAERHASDGQARHAVAAMRLRRRDALERARLQGRLTVDEVHALLMSFDDGVAAGAQRQSVTPPVSAAPAEKPPGLLWTANDAPRVAVFAPLLSTASARRLVHSLEADGADPTLVVFKPVRRPLGVAHKNGVWTFTCGAHGGASAGANGASTQELMRLCAFRGVQMVARPHRRAISRAGRGAIRMEGAGDGFAIEPLDGSDDHCIALTSEVAARCAIAG